MHPTQEVHTQRPSLDMNQTFSPPPGTVLPIIQRLISSYKLWHEYLIKFNKTIKYNLGSKIDSLFTEVIENVFIASHKTKDQKILYLHKASDKFDTLKFFLQIAWEIGTIDNKKYITLSEKLNEIGRMLGGWLKQSRH